MAKTSRSRKASAVNTKGNKPQGKIWLKNKTKQKYKTDKKCTAKKRNMWLRWDSNLHYERLLHVNSACFIVLCKIHFPSKVVTKSISWSPKRSQNSQNVTLMKFLAWRSQSLWTPSDIYNGAPWVRKNGNEKFRLTRDRPSVHLPLHVSRCEIFHSSCTFWR